MKRFGFAIAACALLAGAFGAYAQDPETLTYVDLIHRMTDLKRLAEMPLLGEQCLQWSSYDRASIYNKTADKYVNWDANGDGGQFIREENGKQVLAEIKGPGCIWRTWSAKPEDGHVRIYLDGAKEPVVDLPFKGYFDGQNEPFTRDAIVYTVANGFDNYTPIPFQQSCRIDADPGWGAYFHFTYTTYPEGTKLPTFKRELAADESAALDEVNALFNKLGSEPAEDVAPIEIPPGARYVAADIEGPRAIEKLWAKVDLPPSPDDREVLRGLVLQISWDNSSNPAVWAPLGDFFGTAPGANVYKAFPMGLTENGWWYSNWYMPFEKRARIEILNEGAAPVTLRFKVQDAALERPIELMGRFHAKWHRDAFLPKEPERWIDWTLLQTIGRGRFCGVALHIWNPKGGWWGEGDEKFHVDMEKFPSTIGTGSEDYFGYAWCTPELFTRPYHNQTLVNNNIGHVSVNRFHIVDNIPFQASFEGFIEQYFPNEKPTLYDGVVYWYLSPGGKDAYGPVALEERTVWPQPEIPKVEGALEGEKLEIISKTGGNPHVQELAGFGEGWSNLSHLWWTEAKPGDRLELKIPVEKEGEYAISAQLTKARDYGIVQLSLDGAKLGDPIDLYNDGVIPTGVLEFGKQTLTAGSHTLTLEITGANEKAEKSYMVGLDYVKLTPEK